MSTPGISLDDRLGPLRTPLPAALLRSVAKAPINALLAAVALLWLLPTLGLFLTSLLSPVEISRGGWWRVFSRPALLTIENYKDILANEAITSALTTTLWVSVGATAATLLLAAFTAYALAWLEFPGRDWLFL
ncbi:MAG: carbohydrate ABC transporter permease, partial [Actinomycetota bacterium]|nr:carbohydrate ABC transporter permease [Actinomycetota bacterium]